MHRATPARRQGTEAPGTTGASTDTTAPSDTGRRRPPRVAPRAAAGWTVSTEDCVDPDAANEPIEGTVSHRLGDAAVGGPRPPPSRRSPPGSRRTSTTPTSRAAARRTSRADDRRRPVRPGADARCRQRLARRWRAHLQRHHRARRTTLPCATLLNEECIPQLAALTGSPALGRGRRVPVDHRRRWCRTTSSRRRTPLNMVKSSPTARRSALFYVNNEFGQVYTDAFEELAGESARDRRRADIGRPRRRRRRRRSPASPATPRT